MLGNHKLRQRRRRPGLTDSEVITMEIVGEFLRLDGCNLKCWLTRALCAVGEQY